MNDMLFKLKLAINGKDANGIISEAFGLLSADKIVLASRIRF